MAGCTGAQDWTQWMQWDGEEQQAATYPSDLSPIDNAGTPFNSSHIRRSYPASPSSTVNSDPQTFLSIPKASSATNLRTNGPLTPSHSSSSPETLHLPESRLSGETLRNTSSSELPRLHLKRKSSDGQEPTTSAAIAASQQKPASKKRPHNVIEKRYRANLNEKIAELRQSVPSLRNSAKGSKDCEYHEDDAEDQTGSNKLNKASILTKAVEYIRHLEIRNKRLDDENLSLKKRLLKLERVLASDGNNGEERAAAFTSMNTVERIVQGTDKESDQTERALKHPPQGMIPVPESMKKLRRNQPQEHYASVYDTPHEGQRSGRRWPAKLMIGSLAGLMIVDGLTESQQGSDSKAKGLFGIPLEFMDGWWFLRSPKAFIAAFMQYCRAGGVIPLVKGFLALSILAFVVFAYLFNSKPVQVEQDEKPSKLRTAPSLASPIEVRRQAWLTSMQTLRLPHHSFFPEWFAVTMEWLKYSIRLVLGFTTYSWITGRTEEDELARTKAWDIAIDAQLAGGDPEISRSRLVLSIFGSGTLPQTPTRLMLKALHCRVVLWKVGRDDGILSRTSNRIGIFFAERQWKRAQRLAKEVKANDESALPAHLAELLRHDCEAVMLDAVLQRAYNLMYDRSMDDASGIDSLMDVVVEDHAISSPLDAVAAWWSSQKLHQALILSMAENQQDRILFNPTLNLAITNAPPLSAAYTRALAIKAVFFDQDRAMNAHRVLSALPTSRSQHSPENLLRTYAPVFIDSSMPLSACAEVSTALDCATIMIELHGSRTIDGFASMQRTAADLFATLNLEPDKMGLLSFAPVFHVLVQLLDDGSTSPRHFARTILDLAMWAHKGLSGSGSECPSPGVVAKLDLLCVELDKGQGYGHVQRRQSSVSNDTGYGSLGETEGI
jgi:Domain of unknown function (DUF2014)/Helix-loop-helix DNA-binding domain